jgi:hypothetical protein
VSILHFPARYWAPSASGRRPFSSGTLATPPLPASPAQGPLVSGPFLPLCHILPLKTLS